MEDVHIGRLGQRGGSIEWVKGILHTLFGVVEIQHKQVLAQFLQVGRGPVKSRQCLHGQHTIQRLVDIHGAKLGLVETCQIFVGHHQYAVVVSIEVLGGFLIGETVEPCFGIFCAVCRP